MTNAFSSSSTVETPLSAKGVDTPTENFSNKASDTIQNPVSEFEKNNRIRKNKEILSKFEAAIKDNPVFFQKWDSVYLNDLFQSITNELSKFDIQNVVVETTIDDSILIKCDLQDIRFYTELFLVEEEPSYDIVINLYKNQKHIFGTVGLIKNVFTKVNEFFDSIS
jgi:hypothetical protein